MTTHKNPLPKRSSRLWLIVILPKPTKSWHLTEFLRFVEFVHFSKIKYWAQLTFNFWRQRIPIFDGCYSWASGRNTQQCWDKVVVDVRGNVRHWTQLSTESEPLASLVSASVTQQRAQTVFWISRALKSTNTRARKKVENLEILLRQKPSH